eukprot:365572-Chlamydomonas_euryale.AAC.1
MRRSHGEPCGTRNGEPCGTRKGLARRSVAVAKRATWHLVWPGPLPCTNLGHPQSCSAAQNEKIHATAQPYGLNGADCSNALPFYTQRFHVCSGCIYTCTHMAKSTGTKAVWIPVQLQAQGLGFKYG